MTYIVCGTMVPEEYEGKIPQLSNAANRFLLNFTKEIRKNVSVKTLSYIGIDVPLGIKETLKKGNTSDGSIRYYFKSRYKIKGVVTYWHAIIQNLKKSGCIIVYNPVYAYLHVPCMTKLYGKKSVLILADYSSKETYQGTLRRIYAALQLKFIRKYDLVIGLSENVKKYLKDSQKFIHMYGGIDRFVYDYFTAIDTSLKPEKLVFMYAGTLEKVTGIDLLLEAFEQAETENAELWISGKGSMAGLVRQYAGRDSRIQYLGCPPYQDYLDNLKKADVLVNPRNMNLPENENNFPSKILEYLATGKEIISTKFQGWNGFSEYITFCESMADSIAEEIKGYCAKEYRNGYAKHQRNRQFAEQFIWNKQVERLLKTIETI